MFRQAHLHRSFAEPIEQSIDVQVRLLGPVEVSRGPTPVRGFESRKALALFCFLAEHGEPVTRDELVGFFWEDKTASQGRANLSRVLHNDGALLPGCLKANRYTVQFAHPPNFSVDVADFEDLVRRGDVASLEAAAALYRGDLMRDLTPEGCPRFETWLTGEQERWRKRMTDVLQRLIAVSRERGLYAQALAYAMRILDLDPWREDAHREIMLLHALAGERTAALMQYQKCRSILLGELGVEPGEDTTTLYARIRTGALALSRGGHQRPSRAMAPATTHAPLISRDGDDGAMGAMGAMGGPHPEYLEQVRSRLTHPACRVLSLVGPAGVGKTRLAGLVAATAHSVFPHGVRFVVLGQARSSADITLVMARTLNVPSPEADGLKRRLIYALREQDMLLVLDGVVEPGGLAQVLGDLLRYTPWLKVLVTTRCPLGVSGEWIFELASVA